MLEDPEEIKDKIKGIVDKTAMEQFLENTHPKMRMYLKEKNPQTIEEMSELADRHTEIMREAFPPGTWLGGRGRKEYPYSENKNNANQIWQRQTEATCYHCNSGSHYSTSCPNKDGRKYGQKQEQYDVTCYSYNK
jgi:coenzyme F420-reducing hydrogenase alpha subunit